MFFAFIKLLSISKFEMAATVRNIRASHVDKWAFIIEYVERYFICGISMWIFSDLRYDYRQLIHGQAYKFDLNTVSEE